MNPVSFLLGFLTGVVAVGLTWRFMRTDSCAGGIESRLPRKFPDKPDPIPMPKLKKIAKVGEQVYVRLIDGKAIAAVIVATNASYAAVKYCDNSDGIYVFEYDQILKQLTERR